MFLRYCGGLGIGGSDFLELKEGSVKMIIKKKKKKRNGLCKYIKIYKRIRIKIKKHRERRRNPSEEHEPQPHLS